MATFQVGETYSTRSFCNYDCVFSFTIVKRTAKSVWVVGGSIKEPKRRSVEVFDNVETISPLGKYSMSPVLRAN